MRFCTWKRQQCCYAQSLQYSRTALPNRRLKKLLTPVNCMLCCAKGSRHFHLTLKLRLLGGAMDRRLLIAVQSATVQVLLKLLLL